MQDMFGADFVRMWRLYLAGTVAGFHVGILQLFQIDFALATIPGRCLEHALTYTSKIPRNRTNGVKHACKSWNKGPDQRRAFRSNVAVMSLHAGVVISTVAISDATSRASRSSNTLAPSRTEASFPL